MVLAKNSLESALRGIQRPSVDVQNLGELVLKAGCCWLLVVGCWLLVVGCWLLLLCWFVVVVVVVVFPHYW